MRYIFINYDLFFLFSCGKSTLIDNLHEYYKSFAVCREPVSIWEAWRNPVNYDLINVLASVKEKPLESQVIIATSLWERNKSAVKLFPQQHLIFERMIRSSYKVFAPINISQFGAGAVQFMVENMIGDKSDEYNAVLYLRTPANICFSRTISRARASEKDVVTFEYLKKLENLYDNWLIKDKYNGLNVINLDGSISERDVFSQTIKIIDSFI